MTVPRWVLYRVEVIEGHPARSYYTGQEGPDGAWGGRGEAREFTEEELPAAAAEAVWAVPGEGLVDLVAELVEGEKGGTGG